MSHLPQAPLTLEEMQAKVRSAEPECFCAEHNDGADIMVRIPNSGKLNRIAQGHTANDAWIAAYQILFPSAAVSIPSVDKNGAAMIAAERLRQVSVEGWTPEHDSGHQLAELTRAAMAYCYTARNLVTRESTDSFMATDDWPWKLDWWKPSPDPIRNLVKAGALLAAEIDRLLRNPEYQGGTDEGSESRVGTSVDTRGGDDLPLSGQAQAEVAERGAFEKWWAQNVASLVATLEGEDNMDTCGEAIAQAAWQARASLDTRGETRDLLHDAIMELAYVHSVENCKSGLCTTSMGQSIVNAGLILLGGKFDDEFTYVANRILKAAPTPAPEPVEAGDEPLVCKNCGETISKALQICKLGGYCVIPFIPRKGDPTHISRYLVTAIITEGRCPFCLSLLGVSEKCMGCGWSAIAWIQSGAAENERQHNSREG